MNSAFTNQGSILPQGLRAILNSERADAAADFNCVQTGTIQSVDLTLGTVKVQLNLQRAVYNNPPDGSAPNPEPTIIAYPLLVDVPLYVYSGGTGVLTMPVAAGDSCIVLFNDRDLDPWWSTGSTGVLPNDLSRVHSLADGMALVGIRPKTNPIANWDATRVQLRNTHAVVSVGPEFVRIANNVTSLYTLLTNLANALEGWVNTDSTTPNPATVAQIAAFKLLMQELFEV